MEAKNKIACFGTAIFLGACFAAPANAIRIPRIELLHEARVTGASVLLSDLLPLGADLSLRARAEEISLGAAPQPGNTRVLQRSGVMENIGASREIADAVAVPERIVVSRDARPITVQEVFAAIQSALEHGGVSSAASLRPEDVLLQTQVLVGPGDAGLEVLRAEFDRGMRGARFLLRTSQEPKVLPFFVSVRLPADSQQARFDAVTRLSRNGSKTESAPRSLVLAKTAFLVSPGEQATLLLQSDAVRMIADVIPLERGKMGQVVPVRVLDTGKIFNAQVDGRSHLELNF